MLVFEKLEVACALMLHSDRYMSTSAEAIGVNAQFLYAPDCMLISFLVSVTCHVNSLRNQKKASHRNTSVISGQLLIEFFTYCRTRALKPPK